MIILENSFLKDKKLPPEEELKHLKAVVKSVMHDASMVLAEIELLGHGKEFEEKMAVLDHYLDYTARLCEGSKESGPEKPFHSKHKSQEADHVP